jgi:VanZ family protein
LLQRLIPGRVSSLQDLILNSLGAISSFVICKIYFRSKFIK